MIKGWGSISSIQRQLKELTLVFPFISNLLFLEIWKVLFGIRFKGEINAPKKKGMNTNIAFKNLEFFIVIFLRKTLAQNYARAYYEKFSLYLETNYCFKHNTFEFPSVTNIVRWEIFILLVDIFNFSDNEFIDKPAACKCKSVNRYFVGQAR